MDRLATVLLLAAGIGSLAVPAPATAQPAFPFALFDGPGGSVGTERIAVRKGFLGERRIDRFVLELTLDELRTNGQEVFLGTRQVALADTTLVVEGQPTPRYALVDVAWTTDGIESESSVRACLQLYRIRRDGTLAPRGDLECRELTPADPF
jgi:hypothetical protein